MTVIISDNIEKETIQEFVKSDRSAEIPKYIGLK